ncbi:hypothetical protein E2C01_056153 [Portunus trituberculatus]|uniref:Uncharacterized protein n=1 Tax=Portunus trituberculatus TaxID=210409 RepID=A0A5B7GTB3_PORTR|nr:hypothetical protein [Portunus trituberculatus]
MMELSGMVVSLMSENSAMVAYLQNSGGTQSESLSDLVGNILQLYEGNSVHAEITQCSGGCPQSQVCGVRVDSTSSTVQAGLPGLECAADGFVFICVKSLVTSVYVSPARPGSLERGHFCLSMGELGSRLLAELVNYMAFQRKFVTLKVIQHAHEDIYEEDMHLVRVKANEVKAVVMSAFFKKIQSIPAVL